MRTKHIALRVSALLLTAAALVFLLVKGTEGAIAMSQDTYDQVVLDEWFDLEGIDDITVEMASLDVQILTCEGTQLRMVLESNQSPENRVQIAVERNGNTFLLQQIRRFRIGIFLNVRERLTVYLPMSYCDALALKLSSGNMSMPGPRTLSDFTLKVSSGNLTIGEVTADAYALQATSGNLRLGTLRGSGTVRVTSGNVNIEALIGEQHDVSASSGSVKIDTIIGETTMRVTSGTTRVEHFTGKGSFTASSGSLKVHIDELLGDVSLRCTSGSLKAYVRRDACFYFEGKCTSGSIKADFPTEKSGDWSKLAIATVGDKPAHTLRCDTASGTIKVLYP